MKSIQLITLIAGGIIVLFLETKFDFLTKLGKFVFSSSKTHIPVTPSILQSIEKIGQLISAEYCTETYCALAEKPIYDVGYYIDEEKADNLYIYQRVKSRLHHYASEGVGDDKLHERFEEDVTLSHLKEHKQFGVLLQLCGHRQMNDKLIEIKNKKRSTYEGAKYERHFKERKEQLENLRDSKGVDLVFIGRGCAQAGLDLTTLDEKSFTPKGDTIFISGLNVEILTTYINPWFVPGELPGFEFWYSHKERDVQYFEVTNTKSQCTENIRSEALSQGIKIRALKSALASMFNLLNSAGYNFKHCIAKVPLYEHVYESIIADLEISNEEISKLNSRLQSINHQLPSGTNLILSNDGSMSAEDTYSKLIEFCKSRNQIDRIEVLDQLVLQLNELSK